MQNTSKIVIIVQAKYQEILDNFAKTYIPTTSNFPNLKTYIIHKGLEIPKQFISYESNEWGAKIFNEIIIKEKGKDGYFGILNDDLVFTEGWLEDICDKLKEYHCVSPGYIETEKEEELEPKRLETQSKEGVVEGMFGSCFVFHKIMFRKIGLFDEATFGWEDIDWFWRLKINGFKAITSNKITILHYGALTRKKHSDEENKRWFREEIKNKDLFIRKHGYESHRHIKNIYDNYPFRNRVR